MNRPERTALSVPPNGKARVVCQNFPECMCGDDCTAFTPEHSPIPRRVLFVLMIATAVIGAGLLYAGLRS